MNNSSRDITELIDSIAQDTTYIEEYDGNFSNLLNIAPHIAAFNINDYNLPEMDLNVIYNDTMQHSLPVLMNILSNAYYRWVSFYPRISCLHLLASYQSFSFTSVLNSRPFLFLFPSLSLVLLSS